MTLDDFARIGTFVMSVSMLALCAWLLRQDHRGRCMIIPVIIVSLWVISAGVRVVIASFTDIPSVTLNWWSRINLWYAGVVMSLLLALIYECSRIDRSNGDRGG